MEMEKALLSCVIKKNNDNTYTFIGSDETIDRDGEVIKVDGWQLANYKKNPVVMYGHDHWSPPVGKSIRTYKEDGKLKFKVQFAKEGVYPLADVVRGLVDDDILKSVSVAYRAIAREYPTDENGKTKKEKPRVITTKAELYELSIVNVGANPAALREAMVAKGYDEKSIKLVTLPQQEQENTDKTETKDVEIVTDTRESDLDEIKTALKTLCDDISDIGADLDGIKADIKDLVSKKAIVEGQGKYKDLLGGSEEIKQPPKKTSPFKEVQKQTIFGGKHNA